MKQYHVYGIGAALVDTEIEVDDQFLADADIAKGNMTLVDEARQHELMDKLSNHLVASKRASGGSAANSIIASSYFGAKAFYSCKVANDDNGQFYLDDIKDAGVDSNFHSTKEDGITGKCLVMITPDAERSMNTFLGISETLSTAELNEDALKSSEYLYFEGYLVTSPTGRAAAIKAREVAEQNGVKTAISFSDPAMVEFFKDGLQEMVGTGVDLVFCNEQEAMSWAGSDTVAAAAEAMKQCAKAFAITLGSKGALVWDGENFHNIAPHAVKAIDTNGAGDMFAGAFLYAITHGHDFATAGKLASRASAEVVCHYGPRLSAEQHQNILNEIIAA
jgi:sugar/nucleoside kinase (ribokinase family)